MNRDIRTTSATITPTDKCSHVIVVTQDELNQLGDILDNPFLPLNDLQKALFTKGYRLTRL